MPTCQRPGPSPASAPRGQPLAARASHPLRITSSKGTISSSSPHPRAVATWQGVLFEVGVTCSGTMTLMSPVPVVWPDYLGCGAPPQEALGQPGCSSPETCFSLHLVSRGTWALGSGHDPGHDPEWASTQGSAWASLHRGEFAVGRGGVGPGLHSGFSALGQGACDTDAELRAATELSLCELRVRRPPPDRAQPSPFSCRRRHRACRSTHSQCAGRRSGQTWKAFLNRKLESFVQHTLVVPCAVTHHVCS